MNNEYLIENCYAKGFYYAKFIDKQLFMIIIFPLVDIDESSIEEISENVYNFFFHISLSNLFKKELFFGILSN